MSWSLSGGPETRSWKQRGFWTRTHGVPTWAVCALWYRLRSPFCPVPHAERSGRKSHCGSAQPCASPALGQHLFGQAWAMCSPGTALSWPGMWNCWEGFHPNSNSISTLLVHTEPCPKQSHGITLFPSPQDEVKGNWSSFLINGEQGSRHFNWKEDLTTGTLLWRFVL